MYWLGHLLRLVLPLAVLAGDADVRATPVRVGLKLLRQDIAVGVPLTLLALLVLAEHTNAAGARFLRHT